MRLKTRACGNCGHAYGSGDIPNGSFARSKFCGMQCWRAATMSSVVLAAAEIGLILFPDDRYSLISREDVGWAAQIGWHIDEPGYVASSRYGRLHRLIANPSRGFGVDHINHEQLDNRRENLRVTTQQVNVRNGRVSTRSSTGVRGVYRCRQGRGALRVQITVDNRTIWIGRYQTMDDAVLARENAERQYWGEQR